MQYSTELPSSRQALPHAPACKHMRPPTWQRRLVWEGRSAKRLPAQRVQQAWHQRQLHVAGGSRHTACGTVGNTQWGRQGWATKHVECKRCLHAAVMHAWQPRWAPARVSLLFDDGHPFACCPNPGLRHLSPAASLNSSASNSSASAAAAVLCPRARSCACISRCCARCAAAAAMRWLAAAAAAAAACAGRRGSGAKPCVVQ